MSVDDASKYAAVAYWQWTSGQDTIQVCNPGSAEDLAAWLEKIMFSLRSDRPSVLTAAFVFTVPPGHGVTQPDPPGPGETNGPFAT
jgi:hypothetical protein